MTHDPMSRLTLLNAIIFLILFGIWKSDGWLNLLLKIAFLFLGLANLRIFPGIK